MKECCLRRQLAVLVAVLVLSAVGESPAGQILYVSASGDRAIIGYSIDSASGKLALCSRTELSGSPGPLAISPAGKFLYAVQSGLADRKVGHTTLRIRSEGSLQAVATANVSGRAAFIRVDPTGRFLLAAQFRAGELGVYKIVDGICTDKVSDLRKTEWTVHAVAFDSSGRFVFAPHTRANKVYQFLWDFEQGKLTPGAPPFVAGPDPQTKQRDPRHFVHHPKLDMAYTSNETSGGISAWKFDPKRGTLQLSQTLSTLPASYDGRSAAADIHITPDGRFVYVSNRSAESTLAGFSLHPKTGTMRSIGYFPTAPVPRSFCIDQTGKFIYSAGQGDGTLWAHVIDPTTGKLTKIDTYQVGKGPSWMLCGSLR